MRVVHYVNQFQAGIGGEEAADGPPRTHEGPVGPGRLLQRLIGDDHEIVATVSCGDDHAASDREVIGQILALVQDAEPDLLIAGPAFSSGRYGLVVARLLAAAHDAELLGIGAMHPDNPGVGEAGPAVLVGSGIAAKEMRTSMQTLAAAAVTLASGGTVSPDEGRIGRIPRRNTFVADSAARRAVDTALARLGGSTDQTEIPAGGFDAVHPAARLEDPANALVALASEGALVPKGNPDRLEAARATRWCSYSLAGVDRLDPDEWECIHGGFSPTAANEDPHRILPLDVARELEAEGVIGRLHDHYLVTAGNGAQVVTARGFGTEWAAELHRADIQAVVLTAT